MPDPTGLSAVQVCVAMAVASGSRGLAAAVILSDATEAAPHDLSALADFGGAGIVVHVGDGRGAIRATSTT